MEVELINSDGFSLGIYTDINLINKLKLDGAVEVPICEQNFHIKFWNGSQWIEGVSDEIIHENKIKEAIKIDLHYTKLISDLMRKHIEKYAIDGVEIPTNIIEQRNALRNECNEKIIALGIVDFTYRKTVKGL